LLKDFVIPKESEIFESINPEYNDCDIKISFGYTDYTSAEGLRTSPNFFKYFPMGDETNGFSFIIHCDSFDIEANRRKLHESNKNNNLLPEISKCIRQYADDLKQNNVVEFAKLYANLLISKTPENDSNKWLNDCFFNNLLDYIRTNIPTAKGFESNPANVKIKDFDFPIDLNVLGLTNIKWFYWSGTKHNDLLTEANSAQKLNLEKWSLRNVFTNANLDLMNSWIKYLPENEYYEFIKELDKQYFIKESIDRLTAAKLFKFNNGEFYSIDDVSTNPLLLFKTDKIKRISEELAALGFVISELDISTLDLYEKVNAKIKTDIDIYQEIALLTAQPNGLTSSGRLKLFKNLSDPSTKFAGVGDDTLRKLNLFHNTSGTIKPLKDLISFRQPTPYWLQQFKIREDEYENFLDSYLLPLEEIYKTLILPEWDVIITGISNYKTFYTEVLEYFKLEENNAPLGKRPFVATQYGFESADVIFYNSHFIKIKDYSSLHNAIDKLTMFFVPHKEVLPFLNNLPFKVDELDFIDQEISDNELTIEELKALLEFTTVNNEPFFDNFIIRESANGFCLDQRQGTVRQYFSSDARVIDYLKRKHELVFIRLPKPLLDFKESTGILKEHELHDQIVEAVSGDEQLSELIGLIRHSDPKIKLLLKLKRISIDIGGGFNTESIEYKLLDMACKELSTVNHQEYFRGKLYLKNGSSEIRVIDIPTSDNVVTFLSGEIKLSLAKIFPESYHSADKLQRLLDDFVKLGLPEPGLKRLFGITEELDLNAVLSLIGHYPQNGDQLAFILLYHKYCEQLELKGYYVNTLDGQHPLIYSYYIKEHPFILRNAILDNLYNSIKAILKYPFVIDDGERTKLYEEPVFADDAFICEDVRDDLEIDDKVHLLNFIYEKWQGAAKSIIKKVDWEEIDDTETTIILGFNPTQCVHPEEFAIPTEYLPAYVIDWIEQNEIEEDFLADLKVQVKGSTTFELRNYFKNGVSFKSSRISAEGNEDLLFNTFEWMKQNQLQIADDAAGSIFETICRTINEFREQKENGHLVLEKTFDFDLLKEQSVELTDAYYANWKDELDGKYSIFLYTGTLPKLITLDEIDDYVFRRYSDEHIAISSDNAIFVNSEKDLQGVLYSLVVQEKMPADEILKLIELKSISFTNNDYQALTNRINHLEQIIANLQRVDHRDSVDITVTMDEYTNEIKEKSERQLFDHLKATLTNKKVIWMNGNENGTFSESWRPYDFEVRDGDNHLINYIDCKGTPGLKKTFYLSQNEWEFFLRESDIYQIYRVFNVESTPEIVEIDNLMKWIRLGKVVPYLEATETIKGGRVFLTIKI
jgi:hypothetical protein